MSRAVDTPLFLSSVETFSTPFDYFVSPQALEPNLSAAVLSWLETAAPWKLVETDFYEQYEFSLWDIEIPPSLLVLREPNFLNELRTTVGNLFQVDLANNVDIAAHRLIPGQRIRLHNDFISGQKTYRLTIHLNRAWKQEDGGLLLLFNSSQAADIHRAYGPIHNSAFGFSVSPNSNHAVSTIHGGERFTLVYSFYGKSRNG